MTLSEDLQSRGLIKDKTFDDIKWLDTPQTFYLGVDCSTDSMTIGNLAVLMLARRLANAGWHTVLLVGGATSLIGDPGGKNEERQLKTRDEIIQNVAGIKQQMSQLFADKDFKLVDNYDWFKDMGYLEFLREVGKHFSMTELIQRDFIAARMGEGGSGISYAEFSYSLIQGYDFFYLNKHHDVVLQIGASDQWGNMLSGAPLIRKKEGKEVHAFSMPLVINKATGVKFGKSEAGAVWLDLKRTSSTKFYQFWINVGDDAVAEYLKIYTFLSPEEIEAIMTQHATNLGDRHAQRALADEVTRLVHGQAELDTAKKITEVLTGKMPIGELPDESMAALRQEIPSIKVAAGIETAEVLVTTGLASSKTDARRFITGNAISINGVKSQNEHIADGDFITGRILLRKGKAFKDSALIERE